MAEFAVEDGTLWYETTGDGRPLVFVHGGWLSGRAWQTQVEYFADEYRIVTLDVRGHGRTGETDRDRYSIELFADDLEALCGSLELESPVLYGLSLGSMVVQEYLSRHPDRAAGAVLAGAIRSMPPTWISPGVKPFLSPMPALASSLAVAGPTATFRAMLQSVRATTGDRWLSVDSDVRSETIDAVGDVSTSEFRKVFGALYRYDPPDLEGVTTPTLVVYGDREAPAVRQQGDQIAMAVDDGRYLVLEEAGHLVNQDRPAAFNAATAAFLEELDGTDATDRSIPT
ncbi:alpha/beta fold hydrolase [Natrarchaeobius chitinivorans]|uniref:Alpha/beta hydrolase n=1 Tax=Natrarchaeobius chitinivorans TaxID=1679083 RepID=A0A3N6MM65_NATCH|nr:alpha/beta hydrolase [Natrarchaeobius chitinivorans]RQG97151.1 alpha/beta hydrolase [Natrarchaeobius chitinivorans]